MSKMCDSARKRLLDAFTAYKNAESILKDCTFKSFESLEGNVRREMKNLGDASRDFKQIESFSNKPQNDNIKDIWNEFNFGKKKSKSRKSKKSKKSKSKKSKSKKSKSKKSKK
jgi:hypothetical protein